MDVLQRGKHSAASGSQAISITPRKVRVSAQVAPPTENIALRLEAPEAIW